MLFASEIKALTCICCPLGCLLEVGLNSQGDIEDVIGFSCSLGDDYARKEITSPHRVVSAALCIKGSLEPLSVITAAPIPKGRIKAVLEAIFALELETPVELGAVLVDDIAETGVALVATKALTGD